MKHASLIISLSNNAHFADLALVSLERQSHKNIELIVIADGVGHDVVRMVQTRLPLLPFPARVVWNSEQSLYPTDGQRLLATALRHAEHDYLIFADGDCIAHPEFVQEHCAYCNQGTILTAKRVELSDTISYSLAVQDVRNGEPEKHYGRILADGIFGQSVHVTRGWYLRNRLLRRLRVRQHRHVYASNFSLFRNDAERLLLMNGVADEYTLIRNAGLDIVNLTNVAVQYHLNSNSQRRLLLASDVFERVLRLRRTVGEFGLQPAGVMLEAQRARRN